MAAWQVDFYVVPRRALPTSSDVATGVLTDTNWWASQDLPSDYQRRLAAIASAASSRIADLQTWGSEDGNRVEAWSNGGRVGTIVARIDVRRLDSRFGAALLHFVRSVDAVLVRSDGLVVEPLIGPYATALRTSDAWRFASGPAARPASFSRDDDVDE